MQALFDYAQGMLWAPLHPGGKDLPLHSEEHRKFTGDPAPLGTPFAEKRIDWLG